MFNFATAEYILGTIENPPETRLELTWIPNEDVFCRGIYEGTVVARGGRNRMDIRRLRGLGAAYADLARKWSNVRSDFNAWHSSFVLNNFREPQNNDYSQMVTTLRAQGNTLLCPAEDDFRAAQRRARRKFDETKLTEKDLILLGFFKITPQVARDYHLPAHYQIVPEEETP